MLREAANLGSLVGITLAYSPVATAMLPFGRGRSVSRVAQRWAQSVLKATGVEARLHLPERPLERRPYLVMANHTSHFDVLAIFASVPAEWNMRPVAKRELGYIPVFGWALQAGAAIMIDRGDRHRAKASIDRAAETIRGGRSVLMFPEGTRTPPGELGELKKGPFHLAVAAGVPILPIGVVGSGTVMPAHSWKIQGGRIDLFVGDPIPTERREDTKAGREALAGEVRAALLSLMQRGDPA